MTELRQYKLSRQETARLKCHAVKGSYKKVSPKKGHTLCMTRFRRDLLPILLWEKYCRKTAIQKVWPFFGETFLYGRFSARLFVWPFYGMTPCLALKAAWNLAFRFSVKFKGPYSFSIFVYECHWTILTHSLKHFVTWKSFSCHVSKMITAGMPFLLDWKMLRTTTNDNYSARFCFMMDFG